MSAAGPAPEHIMQLLLDKYPAADSEPLTEAVLLAVLSAVSRGEDSRQPLLERIQTNKELGAARLVPSHRQAALLAWVDAAFRTMRAEHPLDDELTLRLNKLLPVVAAVAQIDGEFLRIGQHPLHRLMDHLHAAGLGWHSRLGRVGEALLTELDQIVTELQRFFESPQTDFTELLDRLDKFVTTEQSAVGRMRERVISSEQGKLKAASARITAGLLLNELMENNKLSLLPPMVWL